MWKNVTEYFTLYWRHYRFIDSIYTTVKERQVDMQNREEVDQVCAFIFFTINDIIDIIFFS